MMATIALVLMVTAAVFQAGFLLRRENRRDPVSHWLLLAAAALLIATLVDRSAIIAFPAVTNTYESLLFFSAAVCVVLFALRLARRTRGFSPFVNFGATILALTLLLIALFAPARVVPRQIQPPVPALQSYWLVLHVVFSFVGEAFFVVSFVAAIAFLVSRTDERRAEMDRLVSASIGIGYPVFTAGALVFGAIWAETAWGAWWSWDPKETWALVTWLIYTAYLHTRLVKRLRGTASAVLALAGFAATVFTFFGVNYLLPGLHAYN